MAARPFDPIQEILSAGRDLFGNLVLTVPSIIALFIPGLIALYFGGIAIVGELMRSRSLGVPSPAGAFFTPTFMIGMGLAAVSFIVLSVLATGAV